LIYYFVKDASRRRTEEKPSKELERDHSLSRQVKQVNRVDYLVLWYLHVTLLLLLLFVYYATRAAHKNTITHRPALLLSNTPLDVIIPPCLRARMFSVRWKHQ